MARDNDDGMGCFVMMTVIAVIVLVICYVLYIVFLILCCIFVASAVIAFLVGITTLIKHIFEQDDEKIDDYCCPITSWKLFQAQNLPRLHKLMCDATLNAAMLLCRTKSKIKNNEDFLVENQKKAPSQTGLIGCAKAIFLKFPISGFYLVRLLFFGWENNGYRTDQDFANPRKNEFVTASYLGIFLGYIIVFILASFRGILSLCGVALFYIVRLFCYWPSKRSHNNKCVFLEPHLVCLCGQIHRDLRPSLSGAGVFEKTCSCGRRSFSPFRYAFGTGKHSSNCRGFQEICPHCNQKL